jgi:hypothetical protein
MQSPRAAEERTRTRLRVDCVPVTLDRVDTELATVYDRPPWHTQSTDTTAVTKALRCVLGCTSTHTQPTVVSEEYNLYYARELIHHSQTAHWR